MCMLTARQTPAGQHGTYSPVEDPPAGSYSPLVGCAPLPGRQPCPGLPGAPAEAPGPLQADSNWLQARQELHVGACAESRSCRDVSSELKEGELPPARLDATSRQPLPGNAMTETSSQAGGSTEGGLLGAQQPTAASCRPAATLPSGSWWGAEFCEELDSDEEGAAEEQQAACLQTVLVQGHQVSARQAVCVELACVQM